MLRLLRPIRNQRGVTLVELMVVVAIIAIIAAIAITLYQNVQQKAKLSADQGTLAAMRSAVAIYYGKNNGIFPGTRGAINLLVTPTPAWQCGTAPTYTAADGTLTLAVTVNDC